MRFSQTVQVQANQRYRVSVRARADEPRIVRLVVNQKAAPFATYLALDDDPAAGLTFTVGTEMQTYEIVGQSALADNDARFAFELADSLAGLVIDDVVFEPTTEPLRGLMDPTPGDPPVDPTDPTDPNAPPGDPNAPPGGTGGTTGTTPVGTPGNPGVMVPNQPTDSPMQPDLNAIPGQNGGLPAPPATTFTGTGRCSMQPDPACNGLPCSVQLGLCYDPTTGYVWDQGQMRWTQPPAGPCTTGVFWPVAGTCYDPESGYFFNPMTGVWEYFGDWYTQGEDDPPEDSGCGIAATRGGSAALTLLAPLALGLAMRRRRRAAR
jgi:hypothetical protein